jgi:hypothetical protein
VKRTLAYSLHEVARILGEGTLVEEELVPVFEEMIQVRTALCSNVDLVLAYSDWCSSHAGTVGLSLSTLCAMCCLQDVEVVQMGVIKHLAKFLAMLPELCRVSYLPLLHDILHSTNPFNWRLRQHLANQLPALVLLPPKQDLYRTLFSTVMILLQDPVASVRRVTFEGVTALINNLSALVESEVQANGAESEQAVTYRSHVEDVISAINSFATGEKYQLRQLWCELCGQLLRDLPREFFEQNFISGILILTLDTVTNVRIALAEFLAGWGDEALPPWAESTESVTGDTCSVDSREVHTRGDASPWHWLLRRADIKLCVERLARDDNDVYLNVSKLAPLYPDIKFSSMTCRGRKAPPGGMTPVSFNPLPMTINLESLSLDEVNTSIASDEGSENNAAGFEELHSSRLASASRDREEHNRSMSSIDVPAVPTPRSRSNSLNIAPIEIDHRSSRSLSNAGFTPPPLLDNHVAPHAGIVADEVDLMGVFPALPPEDEVLLFGGSPKHAGYDDDEDDAAGFEEEALINAAKEAAAASGEAFDPEAVLAELAAKHDAAEEGRSAESTHDS